MLTFSQFITKMDSKQLGGPTVEQLARKHNKSVQYIKGQLEKGIEVELEHCTNRAVAKEIALDHINEYPDYYERLEDMENDAEEDLDEEYLTEIGKKRIRRVRGGKFQRKWIASKKGYTIRGGKVVKMTPTERRKRTRGARRAHRKKKGRLAIILRKRARSMRKRKSRNL